MQVPVCNRAVCNQTVVNYQYYNFVKTREKGLQAEVWMHGIYDTIKIMTTNKTLWFDWI